jgi:hypothetical protein
MAGSLSRRRSRVPDSINTVRGSAVKHVKAVLPPLGALVRKYMDVARRGRPSCAERSRTYP